jgi:hypothetical protein
MKTVAAIRNSFLISGMFLSLSANAFPEFAGDGYFNCTSCHVGASGGDALTPYGRSFAEEKLAMFAYEGEGQALHKGGLVPEWLVIGGHLRNVQVNAENDKARQGMYFSMQRELDVGVKFEKLTAYFTESFARKEADPLQFDYERPIVSKWSLRYDALDSVSVRVGRVMPKYGLNVADHNAMVRKNFGLGTGAERDLIELSLLGESFEINSSISVPLPDLPDDAKQKRTDAQEGFINISSFWAEKHRVSLSAAQIVPAEDLLLRSATLSSSLNFKSAARILFQSSIGESLKDESRSVIGANYLKITSYDWKGIYPFLLLENVHDGASGSSVQKFTIGTSVHPRPHFDFTTTLSHVLDAKTFTYSRSANVVLHYWL